MLKKRIIFKIIISGFVLMIGAGQVAFAQGLNAKEIVKQSDDLMRGNTLKGRYAMTVVTPKWQRRLEMDVWSKGRDKTCIRILSPAKEAGIGTLRIDKNMWNYLPKVERTIKIPPSMMAQPWMGSDFANDDLVNESSVVNDYQHTILTTETVDGKKVYQIELMPKPGAAVVWGKLIFSIREDFVPLREEYFDERGRLIKVLSYSKNKMMSDRVIPTLWHMESKTKEGHYTTIEVLASIYDQPVQDSIFTLANLKNVR